MWMQTLLRLKRHDNENIDTAIPRATTFKAFFLSALCGIIFFFIIPFCSPLVKLVEERLGLPLLFLVRGKVPAPDNTVLIAIDKESAHELAISEKIEEWPRSLHAQLIRKLSAEGATTITFDVYFRRPRDPADDEQLASAIRDSGRVLLFAHLRRELRRVADMTLNIERLEPPLKNFREGAAGFANFALPGDPALVNHFWTFRENAGGYPTLPVATLQLFLEAYDPSLAEWRRQLVAQREEDGTNENPLLQDIRTIREYLEEQTNPFVPLALQRLYGGDSKRYLNFYGPPRSIHTISYAEALRRPELGVRGKAVFVGLSEQQQPEQREGFSTIFSRLDGLQVSGVEILATAFANLSTGKTLTYPAWSTALAASSLSYLITLSLGVFLSPLWAIVFSLVTAYGFLTFSCFLLKDYAFWLPVIVPLTLAGPGGLFIGILLRYLHSHSLTQRLRGVFKLYLPQPAWKDVFNTQGVGIIQHRTQYGICLSTDAGKYTSLSEQLEPGELAGLLNEYYAQLFAPIREAQGHISDVEGDSILAFWSVEKDTPEATRVCLAALALRQRITEFNRLHPTTPLPTRIGIHAGPVSLGSVGSHDHYEYRVVGDTVNTTVRVQALNKHLGTDILVTESLFQRTAGIQGRHIGSFRLYGKSKELSLVELPVAQNGMGESSPAYDITESEVLFAACREKASSLVLDALESYTKRYPRDGVALFYLNYFNWLRKSQQEFAGIFHISGK